MKKILFEVPGVPVPKGRPRFVRTGGFTRAITPPRTRSYEAEIRYAAAEAMGESPILDGSVFVKIIAELPIPKSMSKWLHRECVDGYHMVCHTRKPDLDNIVKSVIDGIQGIVFRTDSQVSAIHAVKVYGAKPKLFVEIEALKNLHSDSKRGEK